MHPPARLLAITLDCPDPIRLARFYQGFLGGQVVATQAHDFAALTGAGGARLDFQRTANPAAPTWPDPAAARRQHLDFAVADMAAAERRLRELGAQVSAHQPGGERFKVFVDPAGHLLCIVPRDTADLPEGLLAPVAG
jgi:catechol 2,3-dioxygenase-like lactoylglutathione lyase family enzyme